jgi:hypothetical protein
MKNETMGKAVAKPNPQKIYVLQRAEITYCPECNNQNVHMLCPEDYGKGDNAFYICFRCGYVGQIGVGKVRRE